MLAELGFSEWTIRPNKEIFLKTDNKVKEVVSQGVPTSVLVKLPGGLTDVILCFPAPSNVLVYVCLYTDEMGFASKDFYFIGRKGDERDVSQEIKYLYGVQFSPWMYDGYLRTKEFREKETRIVNFFIENCSVGFEGALLKFRDEIDAKKRSQEWIEVSWFQGGGNPYHFWDTLDNRPEKLKSLLRLMPQRTKSGLLFWEPINGWGEFEKMKTIPAKIK